MLDNIEYISLGDNPLINNFDIEKINEIFEIKIIEGTKLDLNLFNVDKLENLSRDNLAKLEGKFIEFKLRSNRAKVKLCKNIY